jgi:hypothetical protein
VQNLREIDKADLEDLERQTDSITRNLLTIAEDDTDLDEMKNEADEIVRNLATIAEAEEE